MHIRKTIRSPLQITSSIKSLSFLPQVHATDFDTDMNKEVRYELHRGNGEVFEVDRSTGDIRLKQSLVGLKTEYELLVSAYDGGECVLCHVLGKNVFLALYSLTCKDLTR